MDKDYSKFETKLSAYIDGELPPDEMAEIAKRLNKDKQLAALLEKMRRLDDIAGKSANEFDEDILSQMENNILNNLDKKIPVIDEIEEKKILIIPIWQKYLTIAASIMILFLAGRIAYNEFGPKILSPESKIESIQIHDDDKTERKDAENTYQMAQPGEGGKKSSASPTIIPKEENKIKQPDAEQGSLQIPAMPDEENAPVQLIQKVQVREMTDITLDEKDASDISESKAELQLLESNYVGKMSHAVSPKVANSRRKEIQADSEPETATGESLEFQNMETYSLDIDEVKAKPGEGQYTSIDGLNQLYGMYTPKSDGYSNSSKSKKRIAASSESPDYNTLLIDSLNGLPLAEEFNAKVERLYLQMRANYDLYKSSGNTDFLDSASKSKDSIMVLLDAQLKLEETNESLKALSDQIRSFILEK